MKTTSRLRLGVELLEDRSTPSTLITTVPYVIVAPGTYELASNLYYGALSGNAITVQTQAVVINLNGHKLWSQTGPATLAVGIAAKAESGILIENGTIQGFQLGIDVEGENCQGNQVRNMLLADNWYIGAYVEGAGTLVENNLVENTGACDIPGYTIPIGIHVGGPQSAVLDNRVTGFLWYPGVTREIVALDVDDAPGALVEGNVFKESQYKPNSWGLWITSLDNGGNTTVDLENNVFANLQYGSSFAYAEGQVENNLYIDVATPWSGSAETSVTDLGGNVPLPVMGFSPAQQTANGTAAIFPGSGQARAFVSSDASHVHSEINGNLTGLADKWLTETTGAGTGRYGPGPITDGAFNPFTDAGSEINANLDVSDDDASNAPLLPGAANVLTPTPASAGNRLYVQAPIVSSLNYSSALLPAVATIASYLEKSSYPSGSVRDDQTLATTAAFQNDWWYNLSPDVLAPWLIDRSHVPVDGATTPDAPKPALPFADQPGNEGQSPEGAWDSDDSVE